jgi:hypothetical protein
MLRDMAKLFSLNEANALLPRLREILAELRQEVEEFERTAGEARELRWKVRGNGHNVAAEAFDREKAAREAVNRQIGRVHELGCEIKDVRLGLIDFPSRREGQVVYLCWKLDEAEVGFWHPIDTGFADRRPL